jgi:SAM-dependent methyltransferase
MTSWDERYRRGEHLNESPADLLVQFASGQPPGRALDLACGPGRNAIFLAQRGWRVTAVDSSVAAIEILTRRVRALRLPIEARVADLEKGEFEIEPGAYDLICDFYYLERSLFPAIRAGARSGGHVIAAIHMNDPSPGIPPMNPAFLLDPGELRREFAGWKIIHYQEGVPSDSAHHRKSAEIVAERPGSFMNSRLHRPHSEV